MDTTATMNNNRDSSPAFGHAVVIGSSITGLTAARVLTDYFAQVTIIERDYLPGTPAFRQGVPQARHPHTLPLRGQKILEQWFPGLGTELVTNGAVSIDHHGQMGYFIAGSWKQFKRSSIIAAMTCSRPLLERTILRHLLARSNLSIIEGHGVVGLTTAKGGKRVSGVRLRSRHHPSGHETELAADLVVDASGRASQAPQWLADLGYTPPAELSINAFAGYSSRFYERPADFIEQWKTLYIRPNPPAGTRGGFIIPVEDDRWHVTLIGMARDYPPTDEAGFLEFARSLPTPYLYEAIKQAKPLTKPCGFRSTDNRLRHFDRLDHYLEGFLVCGDAVYALNPTYAQGMTSALMGSQMLAQVLQEQPRGDVTGLSQAFQKQLPRAVADPWRMSTRGDQQWPATKITEQHKPMPSQRRRRAYLA
jgi:2-polyprenyl-6-methoxyphenol hydroxylase-like FAD-dependent oxidoreductase